MHSSFEGDIINSYNLAFNNLMINSSKSVKEYLVNVLLVTGEGKLKVYQQSQNNLKAQVAEFSRDLELIKDLVLKESLNACVEELSSFLSTLQNNN